VCSLGRIAIAPDLAGGEKAFERCSIGHDGSIEDLANRCTTKFIVGGSSGFASGSKQSQLGHDRTLSTSPGSTSASQGPIILAANMIRLLVARHGQSVWNAVGRWQGRADPPLSEVGLAQARAAAATVGAVDAVVTSPLERALVTATLISESIGVGPVMVEDGLMERHAGEFEGLTRVEIDERFPGYLSSGQRPPGWEPDHLVTERALGALDAVAEMVSDGSEASDILAIAHAGIIYALEGHFGEAFERIDNLNGRWFVHRGDGWALGERMSLVPQGVAATEADTL